MVLHRKRLPRIQPHYFQHPHDKAATENLAKVTGIDLLTKPVELGPERIFLTRDAGNRLRVSDTQAPSIYKKYIEAARPLKQHLYH